MAPLTTRVATVGDAAAIAHIYNQGIEERIATFETEPRTTGQIEAQLAEKGDRYPTILVERNGDIVAFAKIRCGIVRSGLPAPAPIERGRRMPALPSTRCTRPGRRVAPGLVGRHSMP